MAARFKRQWVLVKGPRKGRSAWGDQWRKHLGQFVGPSYAALGGLAWAAKRLGYPPPILIREGETWPPKTGASGASSDEPATGSATAADPSPRK